jgi:sigma-E factor negative regulatory protein RseB
MMWPSPCGGGRRERIGPGSARRRPSHLRVLTLAIALALASAGAKAQVEAAAAAADLGGRSPSQWLDYMAEALRERSYDGVFSYFDGEELATLRIVHAVVDGVQRERLVHLDGEPREIVRSDDDVLCILQPDDAILKLAATLPSGPFARAFNRAPDPVTGQYDVAFDGMGRVADRSAVRIAVKPHDEDRYGYRLWIDEQKGLLLRSELVDPAGDRLEIFQFADVRIDEGVDRANLEPAYRDGAVEHRVSLDSRERSALERQPSWQLGWAPAGFVMAVADVGRSPRAQRPVETLMYSDGLAAFSVFVEEIPAAGASNVVSRQGATVAVTHLTAGPQGKGYLVTVVGEVPIETAQRVARSVRFAANE